MMNHTVIGRTQEEHRKKGKVRNILCLWWKWRSLVAAQQRRTKWWPRLDSSPLPLRHTHTHPVTAPRSLRHTYTHAIICCQCYEAHAEFTHTRNKARISSRKWSAGNEAIPNHTISYQPTSSDTQFNLIYIVQFLRQMHHSFHNLVLFWHQLSAHHWCTYVHLSVAQRYKRKWCESVSQLQSVSYVTLLPMCIQPYRLTHALSAASTEYSLPFLFTLTIDHFCESCRTDSNEYCISAEPFHCK